MKFDAEKFQIHEESPVLLSKIEVGNAAHEEVLGRFGGATWKKSPKKGLYYVRDNKDRFVATFNVATGYITLYESSWETFCFCMNNPKSDEDVALYANALFFNTNSITGDHGFIILEKIKEIEKYM